MVESGQREGRISIIQDHTLRRARGVTQWGGGHSRSVQGPGSDPQDTPVHTEEGGGYIPQRKEVS